MLRAIRQHFVDSTKTLIRKSALMTEKEARRQTVLTALAPLFAGYFLYVEIVDPSQTLIMKSFSWWFISLMTIGTFILPVTIYGYYNRHRIDTSGEEPLNYSPGMTGALFGAALVPLVHILFDYFNVY